MKKICLQCSKTFEIDANENAPFVTLTNYCSVECADLAWDRYCFRESKKENNLLCPPDKLKKKNLEAWEFIEIWINKPYTNLYVYGGEGVGKTSLCMYALSSIKNVNRLDSLKIEITKWRITEDNINQWSAHRYLLIDDISAPSWTAQGLDILRAVLDARHDARRRTLVTSNLSVEDLARKFDSVSGDGAGIQILRRMMPVEKIHMTGTSYRLELGQDAQCF